MEAERWGRGADVCAGVCGMGAAFSGAAITVAPQFWHWPPWTSSSWQRPQRRGGVSMTGPPSSLAGGGAGAGVA